MGTPGGLGGNYRFEVTLVSGETAYSKTVTVAVGPWQVFSEINYPGDAASTAIPRTATRKPATNTLITTADGAAW